MKSVSLQRIQPLTEQLNLGLTAGKVWYDTPTDDYNGLQLAAHLTRNSDSFCRPLSGAAFPAD